MSEQIYDVANNLIIAAEIIIEGVYLYIFYNKVCFPEFIKRKGFSTEKLNSLFVPIIYIFCMLIMLFMPYSINHFIASLIGISGTFITSYIAYKKDTFLKIYLSVTYISVIYLTHYLSVFTSNGLFFIVNQVDLRFYKKGFEEGSFVYMFTFLAFILISFVFKWFILHVSITVILKAFKNKKCNFTINEAAFLLIPSFTGLCWALLMREFFLISLDNLTHLFVLSLGNVLFIAAIAINIVLFQMMKDRKEEEKYRAINQSQLNEITSHINKAEKVYEGIGGIKHDIRGHISNMERLLDQNKYEDAKDYVKQFGFAASQLDFSYKTGNPVTDIIINEYAELAEAKGIKYETSFTYPQDTNINAFDLSVVLHNALENALEACVKIKVEGLPIINIKSYRKSNAFIIQCINSFNGITKFDEAGLPRTSKQEEHLHGMGIKNIQRVAGKYFGDMDIESSNNKFILTVMLQCNSLQK